MELILFLETSTSVFSVSLANETEILFNSGLIESLKKERNIATLLKEGLSRIDKNVKDLSLIVVNAGPGGTNSIRSGVSFANSLGYSLKIPVSYHNSFEAIGRMAWQQQKTPIICTAKAINGNMYLGLYEDGAITKMRYGKLEAIFPDISAELIEFSVAGMHRQVLDVYAKDFMIHDSGIDKSNPITLLEIKETLLARKVSYPAFVKPITENSPLFKDANQEIQDIANALLDGGVVLLPTDTVYGLAVNPNIPAAVDKLYEFKARPKTLPLPIMVANPAQLTALGLDINHYATSLLASKYMPGAVTLIMGFKELPLVQWLTGREECGVRIPNDERLLKVLEKTGPLLVTSANKHGAPAIPQSPEEILGQLTGIPDLVISGGEPKSVPSTIINCRTTPPVIERAGNISLEELAQCFKEEIVK